MDEFFVVHPVDKLLIQAARCEEAAKRCRYTRKYSAAMHYAYRAKELFEQALELEG